MEITLREAQTIIPHYFDAGITIELVGPPGLGKSDLSEQLIAHMSKQTGEEWGHAEMFLATQTPPDLLGFLSMQTKTIDGKETRVSSWSMPGWMQCKNGRPVSDYKRGLLILDEYGQGEGDVKRASAQLLLKGEIGPWKLPKGWHIIAISNRSSDRSGVTKSFDFCINRRAELHIRPDVDAWCDWAATAGVSPTTITFARRNPEIVFGGGVPEKQGPWCTPRSLVMADKLIQSMSGDGNIAENVATMVGLTSLIGDAAARQYLVFLRLEDEMPKPETIAADPMAVRIPDKIDARMLVTYSLAHIASMETIAAFTRYVERLGDEFAVTFLKTAVSRNGKLASAPVFLDWCRTNSALMASLR
jgi:hypothetical protein